MLTRDTSPRDSILPNVKRSAVFTTDEKGGQLRKVVFWEKGEDGAVSVLKTETPQGPASDEYTMAQSAQEKQDGLDAPVTVHPGTELLLVSANDPEISELQEVRANQNQQFTDKYATILNAYSMS